MTYNSPEAKPKPKHKPKHKPKSNRVEEIISVVSLYEIRTDLALLKQKLEQLMDNDLKHITQDINQLRKWGLAFFMAVLLSVLTLHLEKLL
jgi:hypothetical protein